METEATTSEAIEKPDDGGAFVPLTPRRAPTETQGPSDAVNLVTLFEGMQDKKGKPLLESMAETCLDDYDADVRSRRDRMKKIDEFEKLKASVTKAKSFPFQNAAAVNLPFLAYVVLQTHARLYDMVVPATGKIMICSPTNLSDVERAGLCEKFANSYIRYDMEGFAPGMDTTLMQMCLDGSAFRRTYWNSYEGQVCSDDIPIEDFVVAYNRKCTNPSLRGVPRYTLVQRLTIFDLEDYAAQGLYENVDQIKAGDGGGDRKKDTEGLSETIKKEDGVTPADESSDDDKERMVLEQYRRWPMPNKPKLHPAFDGRAHYVIVTIDEQSRKILRVVIREEDDPKDLSRFQKAQAAYDQHTAELDAHTAAEEAYPQAAAEAVAMGQQPPELPVPPSPPSGVELDEMGTPLPPKPPRQREICFFTHYKAFPGEGFYGLGFGDFIAPINKAANTLLNQRLDLGTLQNAPPGFISRQLRGARGSISAQPGQFTEVDAPMGVVKDGISWLPVPPGDPATIQFLELLQSMVEKFGGSDIIAGEVPKSNNTATGMTILNEQAMAPITVLARRTKESERHELTKVWRCLGTFLPDQEIFDIIDENGQSSSVPIGREMFRPDARVMPVSDTRMKSQKVQETQSAYSMGSQDPVIANTPPAMQLLRENLLRALDLNQIIPLIQPPPQQQPPPRPHWQEDADMLRGKDSPVHPMDDDAAHIKGHTAFMGTPPGQALDPTQKQMLDAHVRGHMAQQLDKTGADLQNMLATAGGPPEGEPMQQGAPS